MVKNTFDKFAKQKFRSFLLNAISKKGLSLEDKITNKVASPVKVAEYLGAGLKVIISKNIIDYSNIIKDNNLGFDIDEINKGLKLDPVSIQEKNRISDFAVDNFSKNSTVIKKSYNSIIDYFID